MKRIDYETNYIEETLREFLKSLHEGKISRVFDKKILGHINTQNLNVYKQNENRKLIFNSKLSYEILEKNLDKKLAFTEMSFNTNGQTIIEINYEFKENESE